MPLVIKSDGRREPFDRNKIEHGIAAPRSPSARCRAIRSRSSRSRSSARSASSASREIESREIGERVLPRLRALDQVAYVRFASIYRDFRDLEGFAKELDALRGEDTGRTMPRRATEERPTSTRRGRRRARDVAAGDAIASTWRAASSSPSVIAAARRPIRSSAA